MLTLERPLLVFDFETTGIVPATDRVWQIGLVKIYPDGSEKEWESLVNPEMPIPPEVAEATKNDEFPEGVQDSVLASAPKFRDLAPMLAQGFSGSDLCGYNIRAFDIPVLEAEFKRVNLSVDLSNVKVVDVFKLYAKFRPRNLTNFVGYALGEEAAREFAAMAHSALPDARWTWRALNAFLEKHPEIPRTPAAIHEVLFERDGDVLCGGKFYFKDDGRCVMNFGKWKGTPLDAVDSGYLRWILNADFDIEVKRICQNALKGVYPEKG